MSPLCVSNRISCVPRPFVRSPLRVLLGIIIGCLPPFMSLFRGLRTTTNLNPPSTFPGMWAPLWSRRNSHVSAWGAPSPRIMHQDSQIEQEFEEIEMLPLAHII